MTLYTPITQKVSFLTLDDIQTPSNQSLKGVPHIEILRKVFKKGTAIYFIIPENLQ
jgi:hypothetical protein